MACVLADMGCQGATVQTDKLLEPSRPPGHRCELSLADSAPFLSLQHVSVSLSPRGFSWVS